MIVEQLKPDSDANGNDRIDWVAECSLPATLVEDLSVSRWRPVLTTKGILITGATGFLGAAVLHYTSLHRLADFQLYCLVRPPVYATREQEAAAAQRLQDKMQQQGGGMTVCRPRLRVLAADCTC